jgi:type II secretory pathway pseudopilin PulG
MKEHSFNVMAKVLLVVMLLGVLSPAVLLAADATDARIERLEAAVQALQAELNALKAERARDAKRPVAVDQKKVDSMVSKAIESKKAEITGTPSWVSNITPFGDFRYRHETLDNTSGSSNDDTLVNERRRNRIRARLGLKVKINEEWDTTFRIASGSSDTPTSTNQTLDGAFESKDLWLDLAYADWHPESFSGLNVSMGKMKNPFYKVGGNQLIWDGDVNPEGVAAKYNWNFDAGYFGVQGMLKHKFDDGSHLLGGASYYDIGNIDSKAVGGVDLQGNTAIAGTSTYRYDFDIVEGFAEYGWKCNGIPVAVFGNYLQNTAAPSGNDTAYSIGAQLNKAKKPGSWQFKASYREVEPDAVFGGLSDSDFIDGGTGGSGWVLGYKYQLKKNLQAGLTYFLNDRDRRTSDDASGGSGSQYFERLQVDMIFKF